MDAEHPQAEIQASERKQGPTPSLFLPFLLKFWLAERSFKFNVELNHFLNKWWFYKKERGYWHLDCHDVHGSELPIKKGWINQKECNQISKNTLYLTVDYKHYNIWEKPNTLHIKDIFHAFMVASIEVYLIDIDRSYCRLLWHIISCSLFLMTFLRQWI